MRAGCLLACAALVVLSAAAAAQEPATTSRVRADGEKARQLLAAALERSPSVSRLVAELQARELIVLITVAPPSADSHGEFRASTRLAGSGHGQRFATVWIDEWAGVGTGVALLAHELQHALELANAPWVTTQEQMHVLFSRIGRELRPNRFETEAAIEAEAAAKLEVAAHRARAAKPRAEAAGG